MFMYHLTIYRIVGTCAHGGGASFGCFDQCGDRVDDVCTSCKPMPYNFLYEARSVCIRVQHTHLQQIFCQSCLASVHAHQSTIECLCETWRHVQAFDGNCATVKSAALDARHTSAYLILPPSAGGQQLLDVKYL
jgi:hypothetical protein